VDWPIWSSCRKKPKRISSFFSKGSGLFVNFIFSEVVWYIKNECLLNPIFSVTATAEHSDAAY